MKICNRWKLFAVYFAALALLAGTTQAEQVTWVGAGALAWTFKLDNAPDPSATGYMLRAGIEYSDYFGVETHLASGGDDTVTVATQEGHDLDVKATFDLLWGVFLRGAYPLGHARLYGLCGLSNLNMSVDSAAVAGADRITRLSYGAGAEYLINTQWGVNADYIVYAVSDTFDFQGASLGVRYRF